MAKRLEDTGNFDIEIEIEHKDAAYYSDGEVMFPAQVVVHVSAIGKRLFDDSYGFGFNTNLPAPGRRTSTRFLGGNRIRTFSRSRRDRVQKLSLRRMWFAISSEVDSARYAAQCKSQEA
jgi:hypothetical protein